MPYTITPGEGFGLDVEDTDYLKDHFQAPDRWVLNFGPQHPATHTTLLLVLELLALEILFDMIKLERKLLILTTVCFLEVFYKGI